MRKNENRFKELENLLESECGKLKVNAANMITTVSLALT